MSVDGLPTRTTTREKGRMRAPSSPLGHAHVMEVDDVIAALDTSYQGLAHHQAQARLARILPVVIGATVLFEVIGPVLTRRALILAGEVPNPSSQP